MKRQTAKPTRVYSESDGIKTEAPIRHKKRQKKMSDIVYHQTITFAGLWNYDECFEGNWNTHRENITSALREFCVRSETTAKYLINTFGFHIEITAPVHYTEEEIMKGKVGQCRPHFNIKANGKTYHLYTTKNHARIISISEISITNFPF